MEEEAKFAFWDLKEDFFLKVLTCDVLHFRKAAVKPVHCLQELSSVTLALEGRQNQHLAGFLLTS